MRYQVKASVRWNQTAWQIVVLALLLMMAGGLATAQKTKGANARIKDGTWIGATSQGNKISFKVENYQVVGLILPLNYSCEEFNMSGLWESSEAAKLNIKISKATGIFRMYSLKVDVPFSPEISHTFTVQGRFRLDGSALGTLQIQVHQDPARAVQPFVFKSVCSHPVKVTWKATYEENKNLESKGGLATAH